MTVNNYIGKKVTVIPISRDAERWIKKHCGKEGHATLLKWRAERTTVRAPDRKQRTFGPQEATWTKIETRQEIVEHVINLTSNVIADWVEDRDPMLAQAIRAKAWRGTNGQLAPSSAFLSEG